jgi:hypothetical protein
MGENHSVSFVTGGYDRRLVKEAAVGVHLRFEVEVFANSLSDYFFLKLSENSTTGNLVHQSQRVDRWSLRCCFHSTSTTATPSAASYIHTIPKHCTREVKMANILAIISNRTRSSASTRCLLSPTSSKTPSILGSTPLRMLFSCFMYKMFMWKED